MVLDILWIQVESTHFTHRFINDLSIGGKEESQELLCIPCSENVWKSASKERSSTQFSNNNREC